MKEAVTLQQHKQERACIYPCTSHGSAVFHKAARTEAQTKSICSSPTCSLRRGSEGPRCCSVGHHRLIASLIGAAGTLRSVCAEVTWCEECQHACERAQSLQIQVWLRQQHKESATVLSSSRLRLLETTQFVSLAVAYVFICNLRGEAHSAAHSLSWWGVRGAFMGHLEKSGLTGQTRLLPTW